MTRTIAAIDSLSPRLRIAARSGGRHAAIMVEAADELDGLRRCALAVTTGWHREPDRITVPIIALWKHLTCAPQQDGRP